MASRDAANDHAENEKRWVEGDETVVAHLTAANDREHRESVEDLFEAAVEGGVLPAAKRQEFCPHCGGDASDNHFDRSLCACDSMHTCCNNCGNPLDYCPYAAPKVETFNA